MSYDYFIHGGNSPLHLLFLTLAYIACFLIFCLHLLFCIIIMSSFFLLAKLVWCFSFVIQIQYWKFHYHILHLSVMRHMSAVNHTCNQGCTIKGKISDSDLSKIPNSNIAKISDSDLSTISDSNSQLLNINRMKFYNFVATSIIGNHGALQKICFNKSFKRNCTISTGIPNLGVWCKKWFLKQILTLQEQTVAF